MEPAGTDVWQLYSGETLVANLAVNGGDFPWLEAHVEARPGFDALRPLFDAEWAATRTEDWDRADGLYRQISEQLRLVDPEGVQVAEFLLHIQGDDAWWRWSYEPFDG